MQEILLKEEGIKLPFPMTREENEKRSMTDIEDAKLALLAAGFQEENITLREKEAHYMMTKEELLEWSMSCISAFLDFPKESEREYYAHMIDHYLTLDPSAINADGFIQFRLNYVEVFAKKS
jgi:hypothetical protein